MQMIMSLQCVGYHGRIEIKESDRMKGTKPYK